MSSISDGQVPLFPQIEQEGGKNLKDQASHETAEETMVKRADGSFQGLPWRL